MPVQWTEDLATGIEPIDEQHRELYARVAGLHEAMRERRLSEVPGLLDFLQRYVLEHFAAEEEQMTSAGYPGLGQHRRLHQHFVTEFLEHRRRLAGEVTPSAVVELSRWLTAWLGDHVRKVDGDMARFLRRQGG